MITYPIPENETERLQELLSYQIMDTPEEEEFDDIVRIVAKTFRVPVAAISFLDDEKHFVKAKVGLDVCCMDRGFSICNYALLEDNLLEVPDLRADNRFKDFPYVAGSPSYRYYAGIPLITKRGYKIGVLCIVDKEVRKMDADDYYTLIAFARNIVNRLEIRLQNLELQSRNEMQKRISCALSHDIRGPLANVKMLLEMQTETEAEVMENQAMSKVLSNQVGNTLDILNNMIQWGKLQLEDNTKTTEFSLRELVDDSLNEVYNLNSGKFNTLVNSVPADVKVNGEYQGLRFVLRNLLTNAGKFTNNGYITVAYQKTTTKEVVHVKDSGVGMSPETTARLNKKQRIMHTNGTHNETGHGLGLGLVQEYLAKHGKELVFQSIVGIGTVASFMI